MRNIGSILGDVREKSNPQRGLCSIGKINPPEYLSINGLAAKVV
jgi:hypothetical protein